MVLNAWISNGLFVEFVHFIVNILRH